MWKKAKLPKGSSSISKVKLKMAVKTFKQASPLPNAVVLAHYHTKPHFDALRYMAVENIVRKGKIDDDLKKKKKKKKKFNPLPHNASFCSTKDI